jgi:hypothetical protein
MATVTNTHRSPLALPNGQVLQPHQATLVAEWDQIKGNHVIQEWVKSGVLSVSDVSLPSRFLRPDPAVLRAELDQLGVKYDKRYGAAKLRALLADARAQRQAGETHELQG